MSIKSFLCFFSLLFFTSVIYTQSISGNENVCQYNCENYTLENVSGGLFVWNVENAKLDVNTGKTVNICWRKPGTHTIQVIDLSNTSNTPILRLEVTVYADLFTDITFPVIESCPRMDSLSNGIDQEFPPLECAVACENSESVYLADGQENSVFEWQISGATPQEDEGNVITVLWGEAGFGTIQLTETNIGGCQDSIEYCIEILEQPTADITTNRSFSNPCIGQIIYLFGEGEDAVNYEWYVNDIFLSDEQNIEFEIPNGDDQEIALITISECMCRDTAFYSITPMNDEGPVISCVGTTCLGSEETYYAENICGEYNWSVSSEGSIIKGGSVSDNYITVIWNNGPIGEITLSVNNCNDLICNNTMSVQIPIIEPTLIIEGPDETCKSGRSTYTANKFSGTNYNWSLTGNGFIVEGYGTNQITVQWDDAPWADNESTISLTYENCLLECSGSAQKVVTLKPKFNISAWETSQCVGENITVEGVSGYDRVEGDWEVFDKNGNLIYSESGVSAIYFEVTVVGLFEVKLTNTSGDYCNETSSGFVSGIALPDPPLSFLGPLSICKNEVYSYAATSDIPENIQLVWTFNDGNVVSQLEGNNVNYIWTTDGPYSIELLSKNISTNCESESVTTQLNTSSSTSIEGDAVVCLEELKEYELTGVQSNNIIWSITPPTAGNFLVNSGNTAEIIFFEPGNHRLTASFCGFIRDFDVEVEDPPSFTYNAPIGICSGETDRMTISGDLDLSFIVKDEDMNVVSTSRDFQIGPGIYTIEAISPIGCSEIEVVSIDNYDLPDIRISTPDEKGFCQFISPVTFYGLNANDGYTFEWFKDGVALGRSDEIINVTEFGTYTLEVTNINGCKKTSNAIRLFQNCTVGGWCDGRCESLNLCESPDSIKFEATQLGFCNTYSFRNTSSPGVDVNSLFYDFDDPQSGINNRTYLPDADHVFSHAGYYTVMLLGFVPSLADPSLYCDDYEVVQIEVPVAANFEFQKSCANTEYNFLDKSTFDNNNIITNYEWDFGDPSSGADNTSNDRNPMHTYSQSGKYFVSLTITSGTGCIARIIKEVEVLQTPVFDLNLPFEQCINESIKFEALDTGNLIKFLWEFDDPTGGNSNSVASSTTLHKFGTPGIYNVSLTCENNLGCKSTVVKSFQVGINSLTGDISIDKTLPVCEGDSVTMTAPNGGVAYLWSNGHIGQSIKVTDPAEYSVTVINSDACDYVPQSVYLTVLPKPDISITGYTYEDNSFNGEPHYKTLEICQYEYFTLSTQYIVGATYSWSTGGNQFYNSGIQPNNLIPGDHTVTVDVTTNNGCTFTSDPFIITVHPLPDNFTISSNNSPLCEGETYTLSVDAPNPSYEYIWSTGQLGEQIEVIAPGRYYVQAINEFGCDRFSNTLTLHAKPDVSYFQTGCLETCFPDEICFPLNLGGSIITWVKDGEVVSGQNSNTLTVDEAGEYQVIIASFAGCIDTSAILTLEAKPNDQSVSGTVFLDENDNDIIDGLDEVLDNITVNLMTGSTILETSMTDVTGQYVFDPVTSLNTYILIDTTGTGLNVPDSELRLDLIFDQCIEEKILDFPLSKNCEPIIENITLETCSGSQVSFNGVFYNEGDSDMVTIPNFSGCDTTFQLNVIASSITAPTLSASNACQGIDNGSLEISGSDIGDLQFSVDNNTNFTSDVNFNNLSVGTHIIFVQDSNGCEHTFNFEILESDAPLVDAITTPSCFDANNGALSIETSEVGLSYSIDGINYSNDIVYSNLSPNNYDLNVIDQEGCNYTIPFEILENFEPTLSIDALESCPQENNGSIQVNTMDLGLSYSINGIDFDSSPSLNNLSAGAYTLSVMDDNGCVYDYSAEILESQAPNINFNINPSCENLENGSLEIILSDPTLSYSIDGSTFNNSLLYENLAAGDMTLYVTNTNNCVFEFPITVPTSSQPNITYLTMPSCDNEDNGSLEIMATGNFSYSIDGINFINQNTFNNLSSGDQMLTVQDINGCEYVFPFTIEVFEAPDLTFNSQVACADDGNLDIIINDGGNYMFSLTNTNFSSNTLFTNLTQGTYPIFVLDDNNCVHEFSFTIDAVVEPLLQFNTTPSCDQMQNGSIAISSNSNLLEFSIDGISYATENTFENLNPGDYTIYVQDEYGCISTHEFTIETIEVLDVNFVDPVMDCSSTEINLSPEILSGTDLVYNWSNGSTDSEVSISNSGNYAVTISNGCETTAYQWNLEFNTMTEENMFTPNIFSPNNDGNNDEFKIFKSVDIEVTDYNLMITDRWGNKVFETKDFDSFWDGRLHEKYVNSGVYVWMYTLNGIYCNQDIQISDAGDLTVIK